MEEFMRIMIITTVLFFTAILNAEASRPKYYTNTQTYNKVQTYTNAIVNETDDQSRCQAEANHMAANNITGHVWGVIGSFEGVGYGSSPNCNTCVPNNNMRLTGDASAQGRNGMWYRVRSWR